ncbi:tripartite tricarboxylate transporter substrate binding protein [Roseococcus sp. SDR]|uniref:Bug family tripartite tricarboxylate transporter substrate binding protein n=1 Tax=Roseococcus sp. SDR TaxID=2835532 RepID=UPI001BD0F16F|nr:tripartite tricarboxylate transporter substrate binding protein [Roseococcus sp. SDR]MBS7788928.1 tripartite tricarboxylate transporter substrate binding protein [Roseococcus sp. SDR]MBV1844242.1 tripartite tricarboxylate transporter substrate binding protein [Roseococcus sp. SDR]
MIQRRHLLAAPALALAAPAFAQGYPTRPVRIIVPFPPGNMSDLIARVLTEEMQTRHNVQIVVDNRAGATGAIGVQAVTSAPPDGHTLLLTSNSPVAVNPAVTPNLPFDVLRDLAPMSLIGWTGFLIVVPPDLPANNLAELVALMRANPGRYIAANPGMGTAGHLTTEMFSRLARVPMEQVPYRGSAQALLDLSAGRVHFMIDAMTSAQPQVVGGRVKALAVLAQARSPILPDVPSMRESGVPEVVDFQSLAWAGLFGPAGTPPAITLYWNRIFNELLADPAFVRRLATQNVEAAPPGGPERLADILRTDLGRWQQLVRDANIRI